MALSGTVSSPSDIELNDIDAWYALFASFLEQENISSSELTVETDEHEIAIITTNANVLPVIQQAFSSPAVTRQKLHYTLKEVLNVESGDEVEVRNPEFDLTNISAKELLSRIFTEETLDEIGISERLFNLYDNVSEGVLRIPIQSGYGHKTKWEGQSVILRSAMLVAGIKGMRDAFVKQERVILSDEQSSQMDSVESSPAFERVVSVELNENLHLEFIFNYKALLKILFPHAPEINYSFDPASSRWEIVIKRQEVLNYLVNTFYEGFVLSRQKDLFRPIFLPRGTLVKERNLISVVLDCSGSMHNVFFKYISYVESFLVKVLESSTADDIIRIVNFATDMEVKEFVLTGNQPADAKAIRIHLNSLKSDGATYLYNTTMSELKALEQYPNYVESMVIFTDGENDIGLSGDSYEDRQQRDKAFLNDFERHMQSKSVHQVPSVFTMGLGMRYRRELLETWSNLTGVSHTHLNNIDDFSLVFAHLEKMRLPRILVTFMQNLVKEYRSVYEGSLSMLSDFIDSTKPFEVNNTTYRVENTPSLAETYGPCSSNTLSHLNALLEGPSERVDEALAITSSAPVVLSYSGQTNDRNAVEANSVESLAGAFKSLGINQKLKLAR